MEARWRSKVGNGECARGVSRGSVTRDDVGPRGWADPAIDGASCKSGGNGKGEKEVKRKRGIKRGGEQAGVTFCYGSGNVAPMFRGHGPLWIMESYP